MMTISRDKARRLGVLAIVAVLLLQAFNSVACYRHDLSDFVAATSLFVAIPLVPALVSLFLANPLRAVGACALFAPWLLFASYTDCVLPDQGGGASMAYLAVLLWGSLSSLAGALLAHRVAKAFGVEVLGR